MAGTAITVSVTSRDRYAQIAGMKKPAEAGFSYTRCLLQIDRGWAFSHTQVVFFTLVGDTATARG